MLDQKGCVYTPRVLGVRVGQAIEVVNSDRRCTTGSSASTRSRVVFAAALLPFAFSAIARPTQAEAGASAIAVARFASSSACLHVTGAQTNLGEHAQRHAVFIVDGESLPEKLLGVFVTILSHQQRAECGVGKRPVLLIRDREAKCCFCFGQTAKRCERVAALKLRFRKFRPHFERLFVKAECFLQFAARVCALSAFEQPHRIGCVVAKRFYGLRRHE